MSVNLGWCDGSTTSYAERSCKVKFTAGKASQIITLKQASLSISIGGNCPYYQWGRKDPFLPSNGLSDANKTYYDKDGKAFRTNPACRNLSRGTACIKNYILNPNVGQNQHSGDHTYYNLWSADNIVTTANNNRVVKTIYDPSPVGFKLPASNAFTGFVTNGSYADPSTSSKINGIWDKSLKGWNFYTNSSKSKTIFFPASGYRDYLGSLTNVSSYGHYWTAIPFDNRSARRLQFASSHVGALTNGFRGFMLGVRSSRE